MAQVAIHHCSVVLSCSYMDPPYTLYNLAASFRILRHTLLSICKKRAQAIFIIHVPDRFIVHSTVYCIIYFLLPIIDFVIIISSNRYLYMCLVHS